jgi:hypothetical protein
MSRQAQNVGRNAGRDAMHCVSTICRSHKRFGCDCISTNISFLRNGADTAKPVMFKTFPLCGKRPRDLGETFPICGKCPRDLGETFPICGKCKS